jgi:hypothetical protein
MEVALLPPRPRRWADVNQRGAIVNTDEVTDGPLQWRRVYGGTVVIEIKIALAELGHPLAGRGPN